MTPELLEQGHKAVGLGIPELDGGRAAGALSAVRSGEPRGGVASVVMASFVCTETPARSRRLSYLNLKLCEHFSLTRRSVIVEDLAHALGSRDRCVDAPDRLT